ncbi:3' exoribonuclease family protein [Phlyctema vagabunda]|uniref:3' exoribonuclease family protein n=1 Tax=Phlyctema vagabunda TaxID=108571 RepID=A0ABR4P1Z4_9HELO
MPREVEPSQNEKQFFTKALEEEIRLDGRGFDDFRPLSLDFGEEYGVADVRLGKTRVLTHITAEVTSPFPDRPFDGLFTITTELSPMTSPSFEVNRPTETELLLSRLLEKTLRRSSAIDTESLCLIAGQKVWSIRADVHILSHDGNLIDASCIAIIAALQHFRKPDTSTEGESVTVYTLAEREPVPLSLLHHPLCITFSFYKPTPSASSADEENEELTLIDATHLEEQLRHGSVTISMNRHGEICQIAKLGGMAIDAVTLLHCTNVALVKVKELSKFITRRLDEHKKSKDEGGLIAELLSSENSRIPG